MLEILEPILSNIKDLTLYAAVLAAFVVTANAAVTSFGIWAAYKAVYWCAKFLSECYLGGKGSGYVEREK